MRRTIALQRHRRRRLDVQLQQIRRLHPSRLPVHPQLVLSHCMMCSATGAVLKQAYVGPRTPAQIYRWPRSRILLCDSQFEYNADGIDRRMGSQSGRYTDGHQADAKYAFR